MRLCELDASQAFIDKSYLHFSGFADNVRARWDERLCRKFDIPPSKLPRIVDSHTVIGELVPRMARRCGLAPGVPVIAGCGDTAASFLACGATREGVCVDVAGTASVFAATTRQFKADTTHRILGWGQSATPGLWHPYAYINGGGMNLEWFAGELTQLGKARIRQDSGPAQPPGTRIEPSLMRSVVRAASGRPRVPQPAVAARQLGRSDLDPHGGSPVPRCLRGCGTGILRLPGCTAVGESRTEHA